MARSPGGDLISLDDEEANSLISKARHGSIRILVQGKHFMGNEENLLKLSSYLLIVLNYCSGGMVFLCHGAEI